jgi:hypothetical protein
VVTWPGRIDTTPPSIIVAPPNPVAEATGPSGAVVNFSVSANDALDPAPTLSCSAGSGDVFPLGQTVVTCAATDRSGNTATKIFAVEVRDTTPPTLTVPASIATPATTPSGAIVAYEATAFDLVDGAIHLTCALASGTTFPINALTEWTEVSCQAVDKAGNVVTETFRVHVQGSREQVADLTALVDSYALGKLGTSLHDKLAAVQRFLEAGKNRQAEDNLAAFISQVNAQRGKGLTPTQADALGGVAQRIIDVIDG